MRAVKLAIEEDDTNLQRYKRIHLAGCRDLKDPEPLGSVRTRDELSGIIESYGSLEGVPADEIRQELDSLLMPCAAKFVKWETAH